MTVEQFIELLKACGTFAWPVLAAISLFKLFPYLKTFLQREKVTIKIGGMELSAEQATHSLSSQIEDLQNKVVKIEQKMAGGVHDIELEKLEPVGPLRRGDKSRILWVDDFPSNNAIQIEKLMGDGFWIDVASVTKQAVEMFKFTKYDLVISDFGRVEDGVNVPKAGISLAKQIRFLDKNIPIVIFSRKSAIMIYGDEAHEAGAKYVTNSTVDLYQIISIELGATKNAN